MSAAQEPKPVEEPSNEPVKKAEEKKEASQAPEETASGTQSAEAKAGKSKEPEEKIEEPKEPEEKIEEPKEPEEKIEESKEPEEKIEEPKEPTKAQKPGKKAKKPEEEESKAAGGFRQKIESVVKPKEEKKELKILETRIYTIPFRNVKKASRLKRAKRAVSYVKEFMRRHMKTDEVKIAPELNDILWERGIRHVPSKIKVQALKTEKFVTVKPSE